MALKASTLKPMKNWPNIGLALPVVAAGIFDGLMVFISAISMAGALFAGAYEPYLFMGISMITINVVICSLVMAWLSPIKASIQAIQEGPMILLALLGVQIAKLQGYAETSFATYYATILIVTLASAAVFICLGFLRLGNFVRFIPINVVAGFLAGTGCLMIWGGMSFTVKDWNQQSYYNLFFSEAFFYWFPSLFIGWCMFCVEKINFKCSDMLRAGIFLIPMVIGAILFYMTIYFYNINMASLVEKKFFIEPLPEGSFFHFHDLTLLSEVRIDLLLNSIWGISSIIIVSTLILLINISGFELETEVESNFNAELFSSGIANMCSLPFGGGGISFHALGLSVITHNMQGGNSRWVNVIAALTIFSIVFLGKSLISFLPKMILGAFIFYVGITFIYKWMIKIFFSFPFSDALATLSVAFIFLSFGVVSGVACGLVISLGLFIAKYSRLSAVKDVLDISAYPSSVDRNMQQRSIIREHKNKPLILFLKGYIFFGNSHDIREEAKHLIEQFRPLALIFDFAGVYGIDNSSISSFIKIATMCQKNEVGIFFSSLDKKLKKYITNQSLLFGKESSIHFVPTLDQAVEMLEETIIAPVLNQEAKEPALDAIFSAATLAELKDKISMYFTRLTFHPGESICKEEEWTSDMYLLEKGSVAIYKIHRVSVLKQGSIFGDLSFFMGQSRSAEVIALEECTLLRISQEQYMRFKNEYPQANIEFLTFIMKANMNRLMQANQSMKNLRQLITMSAR